MKKIVICLIATIILVSLIGCTQTKTFDKGLTEIDAILVKNDFSDNLNNIDFEGLHDNITKDDVTNAKTELIAYKDSLSKTTEDEKALSDLLDIYIETLDLADALLKITPETFNILASGDFVSFCGGTNLPELDSEMKDVATKIQSIIALAKSFQDKYPTQATKAKIEKIELKDNSSIEGLTIFANIDKPFERMCSIVTNLTITGKKMLALQQDSEICDKLVEYQNTENAYIVEMDDYITFMEEMVSSAEETNPESAVAYTNVITQMKSLKVTIQTGSDAFIQSACGTIS